MAKKKKESLTHVSFILDETGSMFDKADETIHGCNDYVAALSKEDGADNIRFTLSKFSSAIGVEVMANAVPLADVPKLGKYNYTPNGWTPLYDAIGKTVRAIEGKVGKKDRALVAIMTDGLENASKEWTAASIRALIGEKEAEGWTFAYLGSHADTFLQAAAMGINRGSTMHFAAGTEYDATQTLADATCSYAATTKVGKPDRDFFARKR